MRIPALMRERALVKPPGVWKRFGRIFVAAAVGALAPSVLAERNNLKPSDLAPLTSLPWKKANGTMENVLEAIFRETNTGIRYRVLGEYLRVMPVGQLGKAFDACLKLEGTQSPDDLVDFYLRIWAQRDPAGCWKRTRGLFHLVGIEDGWMNYDSWRNRERITARDLKAIRASSFWLQGWSLAAFPVGVDASSVTQPERVRLMKEFTETWFDVFKNWPEARSVRYAAWNPEDPGMLRAFEGSTDSFRDYPPNPGRGDSELAFEVAVRRWLEAEPASATKIVSLIHNSKWPESVDPYDRVLPEHPGVVSTELLMIWARCDLPGMIRWAESLNLQTDNLGCDARGFLMSRVDPATRERWFAEAKSENPKEDLTAALLEQWAFWDPRQAWAAALATKNFEALEAISSQVVYGPFRNGQLWNTAHFGLGVIKDFDVAGIPEPMHREVISEWGIIIMEEWGGVDVGEAARYGLDFMLRNHYAPRENLIKLFSGDDNFSSDSDMIDRTFCALRVWAVVRPEEMAAWIKTQENAEMRKALTWLLKNPWGGKQ